MAQESQSNRGVYKFLNFPLIYNCWQYIMGGEKARATIAEKYIKAQPGERVLDIGCGTGTLFELMGKKINYVGYDISEDYINFAKKKFKNETNAKFYCTRVNEIELFEKDFDVVIAIGILHHLDDEEALRVLELANMHLKQDGRFILCEPMWIQNQNRFAKLMLSIDRGKAIRNEEQYTNMLDKFFTNQKAVIDESLFNVPYTICVMEAQK
jgi:2-polyprenyl-3-methyl-5-hydroxy-6-metoxy-1,4-benzoquinol methylase